MHDTQSKVEGWNQAAMAAATVLLVGAGGIGSAVGHGLVRMGIGELIIIDDDVVTPSNLNRQYFTKRDLYKPKALRLAKNLAAIGFLGSTCSGFARSFCEHIHFMTSKPALTVVGVDNDRCRGEVARWAHEVGIPLVAVAVARDASSGYVFVQEPEKACLGCYRGKALLNDNRQPCPGTPAVIDVLQVLGGLSSYAVSTLLMPRPRAWNLARVSMRLASTAPAAVDKRMDCPICSTPTIACGAFR